MTKPAYANTGWPAWSKESGDAAAPVYAWGVNLNNGNANINNRNNEGLALPVSPLAAPASEYQSAGRISRQDLFKAFWTARKGKVPSCNRMRFEADWHERITFLEQQINSHMWLPLPTSVFVAETPKARQIHAPDFEDRVVHHWIVPKLEQRYEPIFIADSYANRRGKGCHAAVRQLTRFVRQVASGQGRGWYLQLDIANCFNSINRKRLWRMVRRMMQRWRMPEIEQRVVHALLRRSPLEQGIRSRASPAQLAKVPYHKRLEAAAPGCGLPIGSLPSQFLANVYLNALDQFVKHVLKAKRYLRYADDFVLVHESREQLQTWHRQIEAFLHRELGLRLKDDVRLRPLEDGIDFLGYIVRPTHTLVRRRVVTHAKTKLQAWERAHVRADAIVATPEALRAGLAVWRSYQGHFQHANTHRLQQGLQERFPWLPALQRRRRTDHRHEGRTLRIAI